VDPTNPNTLYAAAGVGVFKSTNGGLSWSNTGLPAYSSIVNALALDPSNPAVVYVASNSGVFVSTNAASTWTYPVSNSGCSYSLTVVPTTPTTIYTGTCGYGLYKSTDGGQTFASVSPDLATQVVISIAVDPTAPSTLYAATNNGVSKSTNSGQSWTTSSSGLSGPVSALAIDAAHSANVWAGNGSGLFESTNGGQTWSAVAAGLPSYGTIRTIVFDPFTHSTMYAGTSGGVYKSTNAGQTWSASNSGLPNAWVYGIVADPVNSCVLYAATTFDTVYRTVDCGANWFAANSGIEGLGVNDIEVDPGNPSILYVGTNGSGLWKSLNGGLDWSNVGPPGIVNVDSIIIDPASSSTLYAANEKTTNGGQSWTLFGSTCAIDPENSSVLYGCGYGEIYKTTNGGQSWNTYSSGLPANSVGALVVDPANSSNVYAGLSGSGVYKSTDGGQHWAAANAGFTSVYSPPAYYVQSLGFDKHVPAILYAGLGNAGLFKSADSAQSWSKVPAISTDFYALVFDPSNTSTFYVGGFRGISKTIDGGQTWTTQNSGLDVLYVQSMAVSPSIPSTLYAGTFGGLYTSTDSGATWRPLGTSSPQSTVTIAPAQGMNNTSVQVLLSGSAKLNGASLKLSGSGLPDISGTNTSNSSPSVLLSTFNLNGATPGVRDVAINFADGTSLTLYGGFTITQAPVSCTYTVAPLNPSFPASGGSGNIVVTSNVNTTQCNFHMYGSFPTNVPWITAGAVPHITIGDPGVTAEAMAYSVAANPSSIPRSTTVLIAGQNVTVSQAGFVPCTYNLSPASGIFAPGGGSLQANVVTGPGCAWSAFSALSWAHVTAGSPGSGSGSVTIQADPNAGLLRSGVIVIAGKPFSVSQGADACGANDVSSQVLVSRGPILSGFIGGYYAETVTLRNQGTTAIAGPVYLVLDGLPATRFECGTFLGRTQTCGVSNASRLTFCASPSGSDMVLIAPNGLTPGQAISAGLTFIPGASGGASAPGWYTTRVFSGIPTK
jgi:photosystem II stability/assembly factor-like uncharacterized protein